jgi:hypothetical protein
MMTTMIIAVTLRNVPKAQTSHSIFISGLSEIPRDRKFVRCQHRPQLALVSNSGDKIATIQPNEAIRRQNSLFKTEHANWSYITTQHCHQYRPPRADGPERRARHRGCHRSVVLDHRHACKL